MAKNTIRRRTIDAAAPASQPAGVSAPRRRMPAAAIKTEEQLAKDPDMVMVTVPKEFRLTLDHHNEIKYQAGAYRMPVDHATHWYAKANGVTIAN